MNILFLHKDFPGPFKYLAAELAKGLNNVFFITNNPSGNIEGVKKMVYKTSRTVPEDVHQYLKEHEEALIHAKEAANILQAFKIKKFKFDVIFTQAFGPGLFVKYIFPETPVVICAQWYNKASGSDLDFDGNPPDINYRAKTRCSNSCMLIDLYSCEACALSSQWQKNRFPKEFHDKIKVLPDIIDTEFYKPDANAEFLGFSKKDEIITYTNRGIEPYRGFPEFMQAAEILLKKRPDLHVIIAGEDKVFYRPELFQPKYKDIVLEKLDLDMNRIHFTGFLQPDDYLKLLQISSAHVYLTYPYILSESLLNAMSAGCCVVASNTASVLEVVKDNYNGLLFDFYNINQLAEKVEYALDNKENMQEIRNNARQTIIDKHGIEKILPEQINFVDSMVKKKGKS